MRSWGERNSYGYTEECCEFEAVPAARARIGHPRVFKAGDRSTPLDII
ncbi:hypothetical protein [Roseimaritima ulvae]|nr:hypothetical protein [Roseimaritima ulvae]